MCIASNQPHSRAVEHRAISVRIAALGMSKDKTSKRPYSEQDEAQRMVRATIMPTPLSAYKRLESRDGSDFN